MYNDVLSFWFEEIGPACCMHSESIVIHRVSEALYREHGLKENYDFELSHHAIIARFGRYPHRNEILGRASTPEELEFLKQPGSKF